MYNLDRLQEELPVLRAIAGWTIVRLAKELGISRTTAICLENRKTKMTKLYYMAIMYAFISESANEDNYNISRAAMILVLGPENRENKKWRKKLHDAVETVVTRTSRKKGMTYIKNELDPILKKFFEEVPHEAY